MDDNRKMNLIYGVEKFTLDDVKYLAKTFKAQKVCLIECVDENDCECSNEYGILLTPTMGNTDWRMLQELFEVYDDEYEYKKILNIELALYLGIVGQEDSCWQMEELFNSKEIEEYKKEREDEEDA